MSEPKIIEAAKELLSRIHAKESLHEFVKQSWPILEGGVPFIDSWHIGAVCEHIEAVVRRDIRNLLINVPPRTSKSTIISICLPAWCWITWPETQFIYGSYGQALSIDHSVRNRRLIESQWYQLRWGNSFKIVGDQNTKSRFDNNKRGYRIATSCGSYVTGFGGNILVLDDPNNAEEGESDAIRESTNTWYDTSWSTRLNDPKKDCKIVVQQRIHESDISGHIIQNDRYDTWTKLILPMEFESIRRAKTIILPSTKPEIWEDPRKREGQLLCPDRMDIKEVNELKSALGSEYRISGQLQQRPSPEAGGIIKKVWFKWWKKPSPPKLEHVIQSWDTALSAKDSNCYSACTTWGLFYDDFNIMNVILLSLMRAKLEYPDLRRLAIRMYNDYRDDDLSKPIVASGRNVPDVVLIEAKVSGISLIQDLQRAGIIATRFDPDKYGDKIQRVRQVSHLIENGRVWLPSQPPDYKKLRPFADLFIEHCAMFPNADSRDLVDTMTQVLLRLSASGWLTNSTDPDRRDTSFKGFSRPFY